MQVRLTTAIGLGKLAGLLSRRLHVGGGTTYPGTLARRIDPSTTRRIAAALRDGSIVVSATNGKTTTTRMLSAILRTAGQRVVHNRSGANLLAGVTTALVANADLRGRPQADIGLFEVDEAMLPATLSAVEPRVVTLMNLFRDQLDRYGEIDYLASLWRKALQKLPATSNVVLNADDPLIASLGRDGLAKSFYYGIGDTAIAGTTLPHAADSSNCVICGTPYQYSAVFYGHVGHYRCPQCGYARPEPQMIAQQIKLDGIRGSQVQVCTPKGTLNLKLRVPGLYNVYNALAAAATAFVARIDLPVIEEGINGFSAAFGRIERVKIGDKEVLLALIKNPVGCTEVLRMVTEGNEALNLLCILNDRYADGTDISWIWDADWELLAGHVQAAVVAGTRAEDMAVRLKYAEIDPERIIQPGGDLKKALDTALDKTPSGGTLYVLPTYTAMLELRSLLAKLGYVNQFWED